MQLVMAMAGCAGAGMEVEDGGHDGQSQVGWLYVWRFPSAR